MLYWCLFILHGFVKIENNFHLGIFLNIKFKFKI